MGLTLLFLINEIISNTCGDLDVDYTMLIVDHVGAFMILNNFINPLCTRYIKSPVCNIESNAQS